LPGARRRAFPAGFAPELCIQKKTPPDGDDWIHETKWDGYRLLADLDDGKAALRSRNDLDWTAKFADIAAAIEALPVASARLDGELIAVDARGNSDFSALQRSARLYRQQRFCCSGRLLRWRSSQSRSPPACAPSRKVPTARRR